MVLFLISYLYKKNNWNFFLHWLMLPIIFLYLAFDELMEVHESFFKFLPRDLNTTGIFYFAWVIPPLIALPFFLMTYYKFLLALPKKRRNYFCYQADCTLPELWEWKWSGVIFSSPI